MSNPLKLLARVSRMCIVLGSAYPNPKLNSNSVDFEPYLDPNNPDQTYP